jgi:hypothetical protein
MDEKQKEQFRQLLEEREKANAARAEAHERRLAQQPDSVGPRTKSSGHGKKTADKWNQ